jgi:hypothetical protein
VSGTERLYKPGNLGKNQILRQVASGQVIQRRLFARLNKDDGAGQTEASARSTSLTEGKAGAVSDWTSIATAVGSLLGGLALPIAFIQLGQLRSAQARAQIDQVGAWVDRPEREVPERDFSEVRRPPEYGPALWKVTLHILNSSELPILLLQADLLIQPMWKSSPDDVLPKEIEPPYHTLAGHSYRPSVIAPGRTWTQFQYYDPYCFRTSWQDAKAHWRPEEPQVSIESIELADAAGRVWKIRPSHPGPAKRVGRRQKLARSMLVETRALLVAPWYSEEEDQR